MDQQSYKHICSFLRLVESSFLKTETFGDALIENISACDSLNLGQTLLKLGALCDPNHTDDNSVSCTERCLLPFFQFFERIGVEFDHGDVNVGGGSRLAGIVVYEETAYNCLCNLLVDAVSEANPRRKEFIGLIMKMDKSAQKSLMRIIKDGKTECVKVDLIWEVGGIVTPRKHGGFRSRSSPGSSETPRRLEAIIKELKREKAEVEGKLKDQFNHNQQLSEDLKDAEKIGSKAAITLEIATLEKYENLDKDQKATINALTEKANSLRSKVKTFDQLQQQVLSLTDELSILKHSSAKLPSLERSLESYKEKLENFNAIKIQLQDEQKAHGEAIDKLIKLENENKTIPNLKKQLETYKKKSSDLSVANETLSHELGTLKKLSSAVQKQNAQLSTTTSMQLKEAQELQKLLVESYGGDDSFATAVGEGVSELNPKIAEELSRLKNDNDRLVKIVNDQSADNLQNLLNALEDANLKCESFKKKFLTTNEDLKATKKDLEAARALISAIEKQLEETKAELESALEQHEETKVTLNKTMETIKKESEDKLCLLRTGLTSLNDETLAELKLIVSEKDDLVKSFQEHAAFIEQQTKDFAAYKEGHSLSNEVAQKKQKEYKHKLTVSMNKQSSLESEIDEMQVKLRKMQRERGNLQEDLDRLRTQGASYMNAEGDMEAQYEALQREYNALVEENKSLKDGGMVADGDWSGGGGGGISLNVMRKEYEEKIMNLNEERRELVMKISAHASDLQKSETRSWQLQQQVSDLQDTIISLNLQIARHEDVEEEVEVDNEGKKRSALGDISNLDDEDRGAEQGGKRRQQPASLLGAMGGTEDEGEKAECKQS